jgi:hypothetical protein
MCEQSANQTRGLHGLSRVTNDILARPVVENKKTSKPKNGVSTCDENEGVFNLAASMMIVVHEPTKCPYREQESRREGRGKGRDRERERERESV